MFELKHREVSSFSAHEASAIHNYSTYLPINATLAVKTKYDYPLQTQAGQYASSNCS